MPERTDEGGVGEGASRFRTDDPTPRCPQLRACRAERLYPVQGYCVLADTPGWFMIPSIEEYREHCTTPRWGDCCWFRGNAPDGADEIGSAQVEARRST